MTISSITSLPEDIIIDCVARVPRRYYPTLSMVSKLFRSLIASPELYERRSLLDRTECCLYVTMSTYEEGHRLYTLVKKSNSTSNYCLVPITSLPSMPTWGSYVAADSKIFVMGDSYNMDTPDSSNGLLIDCRLHKAHHDLPSMPMEVANPVSSFKNGNFVWTTVMLDGKVLLFSRRGEGLWCEVIKMERDEQGEMCGSIEWSGSVFKGCSPYISNFLVVKV